MYGLFDFLITTAKWPIAQNTGLTSHDNKMLDLLVKIVKWFILQNAGLTCHDSIVQSAGLTGHDSKMVHLTECWTTN